MDKLTIDKFNGKDFNVWKFQLAQFLDYHDLLEITNANQMWKRLESLYEKKSSISIHLLLKYCFKYEMDPKKSMAEHVVTNEEMAIQFQHQGQKQDEVAIITTVLISLPANSKAYKLIDAERLKFSKKSLETVLIGYEPGRKAYRLWERGTHKVHISRDVEIIESLPRQVVVLDPQQEGQEQPRKEEKM
ncbi:hypothetical protein KM043_014309 [Ampulex compressa]|nr:hypothetical protein KM043_014309 [Ampulex compressa]